LKTIHPERLVYVDECGIGQDLHRAFAYAPRGQKVVAKISGKKFKRTNIVAGVCQNKWVAPMEYSGTTDSALFEFWFESCLLKEVKPEYVIVLDNATFHKKSVLANLARLHGCEVLFLPPYSPDLNPIEKKWAWIKRKQREILPSHQTFDAAVQTAFQVS